MSEAVPTLAPGARTSAPAIPTELRPAKALTEHIVEVISDSGEGAQRCGQSLGAIAARTGNGIWTTEIIPAEIQPPARSVAGASGIRIRIGTKKVTNGGDETDLVVAFNEQVLLGRVRAGELKPNAQILLESMWSEHRDPKIVESYRQTVAMLKKQGIPPGMVSCIEADNLFYSIVKKVEGDHLIEMEDFADLIGGARVMLALAAKYRLDGNAEWLGHLGRLAKGFHDAAVYKDDYAYYPDGHMGGAVSRPRTGWKTDQEPIGTSLYEAKDWYENATNVLFTFGGIVQGLCQWFQFSGEQESLELAGKLVKFMLKPRFWQPEAEPEAIVSAAHAHFEGHIHATVRGLWGLLEYAVLANDEKLKAFVRDGYEYVRTFGIARIGLLGEGCTVGDMTCLAIKLTDAGMGDYWEDVDQYVRNHLTELQILEPEPIRRIAEASPAKEVMPWEDADRFIERQIGALCDDATHPTLSSPGTMHCCTYNGLIGYYYAWEGIIREKEGVAQVNLLLNRASPWLDVDSYLPYEGKVVIHNKLARRIAVRIPRWANLRTVRSRLNEQEMHPYAIGRYLIFDPVAPGDRLMLDFPMVESTETYQVGWEGIQIPGWTEVTRPLVLDIPPQKFEYVASANQVKPAVLTTFTCKFKGNTLIDISPREQGLGYPLYRREHYKQDKAPFVKVTRTVTHKRIDL